MFKRLTFLGIAVLTFSQAAAQITLPPKEVDKYRTKQLISRIDQLVSRIVPENMPGMPPEQRITVIYPEIGEQPKFYINTKRTPIRITLPNGFNGWAFQPETIFPFVHTYLSARAGSKEPLSDAWITAAIIYDLYDPGTLYGASGFKYSPYAKTMLAYGYPPNVKNILDSKLPDFYEQFYSAARMEWCSLLLKQATRRTNNFEQILFRHTELQPSERLTKLLLDQEKKGKAVLNEKGRTFQEWFEIACTRSVLGRRIPASVPLLDESFSDIMNEIHPHLKVPEKKKNQKAPVLSKETLRALVQAEMKLNFLALIAPEQIALKFYRCAMSIRDFRQNPPTQKAIQQVLTEKKASYAALSDRAAVEYVLKQAEQRLISPGKRFALTIQAVSPVNHDIPLLKTAHALMDHFE